MANAMTTSLPATKPPWDQPRDIISEPRLSWFGQLGDVLLGKGVTLLLATLALLVGIATFIILARGSPLGKNAQSYLRLINGIYPTGEPGASTS